MALILHIDTALQQANIGIANNGELVLNLQNENQNSHASFVQPAIQKVLSQTGISINNIDAIGVTAGPGSYTGLRVAMASAKGLCYALQKPLVCVSTLQVMAIAATETFPDFDFYCPMIDARRNEVYTAVYNNSLEIIMPAQPLILNEHCFEELLVKGKMLFCGNGAMKCKNIINANINSFFEIGEYNGVHLAQSLFNCFKNNHFGDVAYAEPMYLKDFYTGKAS